MGRFRSHSFQGKLSFTCAPRRRKGDMRKLWLVLIVALSGNVSGCVYKGHARSYDLAGMWAIYRGFSCTDNVVRSNLMAIVGSVDISKKRNDDAWEFRFGRFKVLVNEIYRSGDTIYLRSFSFPVVTEEGSGTIKVDSASMTVRESISMTVKNSILLSVSMGVRMEVRADTEKRWSRRASCSWEYELAS